MEGFLLLILLFWLVPKLIEAAKKKNGKGTAQKKASPAAAAQRKAPTVELHRPVPSMKRPEHRDFSAPEAPCIVCEQTGEDHFQRDKARRIAQLDDWLKNGIIDRDEYRVLKDRYLRDI